MQIKVNVFDLLFESLRQAGLPVADERIPFPGSGQQGRFREKMREALEPNQSRAESSPGRRSPDAPE
jgi:hypothetical protein